jgi:hypothetical protein
LGSQDYPYPCRDGNGGIFVSWEDHGAVSLPRVQHLVANGTRAAGWPVEGVALCLPPGTQYPSDSPSSDGAGGVFVQVSKADAITGMDVYLARVRAGDRVAVGPPGRSDDARFGIRGVTPNPARSVSLSADVDLPDPGVARLDLLDLAGRLITSASLEAPKAGSYRVLLAIDARQPPGLYLLRLTLGTRYLAVRVALIR